MVSISQQRNTRKPRADGVASRTLVLTAILKLCDQNDGRPPTYAEIAQESGINRSNVGYHVQRLAAAGVISLTPGARGIIAHPERRKTSRTHAES